MTGAVPDKDSFPLVCQDHSQTYQQMAGGVLFSPTSDDKPAPGVA